MGRKQWDAEVVEWAEPLKTAGHGRSYFWNVSLCWKLRKWVWRIGPSHCWTVYRDSFVRKNIQAKIHHWKKPEVALFILLFQASTPWFPLHSLTSVRIQNSIKAGQAYRFGTRDGHEPNMKQNSSRILSCLWFMKRSSWQVFHHEHPQTFEAVHGCLFWFMDKTCKSCKNSWTTGKCFPPLSCFRLSCTVPLKSKGTAEDSPKQLSSGEYLPAIQLSSPPPSSAKPLKQGCQTYSP